MENRPPYPVDVRRKRKNNGAHECSCEGDREGGKGGGGGDGRGSPQKGTAGLPQPREETTWCPQLCGFPPLPVSPAGEGRAGTLSLASLLLGERGAGPRKDVELCSETRPDSVPNLQNFHYYSLSSLNTVLIVLSQS